MLRWLHRLASGDAVRTRRGFPDPEKLEPVVREIERKVADQARRLDTIEQELTVMERRRDMEERRKRIFGNSA